MPRSKHRRKGKIRPRLAQPAPGLPADAGPGGLYVGDEEPDYGFAYDPSVDPDPEAWLALDEMVRALVVEQAHRDVDFGEANPRAHALAHVMVENGIAEADRPTRAALERLQREGLDRHEAVHAIGSVLMGHIHEVLAKRIDDKAASDRIYRDALEKLTAETWRRDFGPDREDEE